MSLLRLTVGGLERTATVLTPAGGAASSVVVALHGSQSSGAGMREMSGGAFDRLVETGRAVVAYPDAYRKLWNDDRRAMRTPAREAGVDDVVFLRALLAELGGDSRPVVLAGWSNGGHLALRVAHEAPDLISGVLLFGANEPTEDNLVCPPGTSPVAVTLVHGTKDRVSPYRGGMVSLWGFRPRGTVRSSEESARYWAARNGIVGEPVVEEVPASGRTSARVSRWAAPGRAPVTLHSVLGGGHTVPSGRAPFFLGRTNRDLDVADLVLDLLGAAARG